MRNSQKTKNVDGKKLKTNDPRNDQRTRQDTKHLMVNNSRARLANSQVVLQNTFAVLGDLVEEEIDQIVNPTSVLPQRGQGGNEGNNQSEKRGYTIQEILGSTN